MTKVKEKKIRNIAILVLFSLIWREAIALRIGGPFTPQKITPETIILAADENIDPNQSLNYSDFLLLGKSFPMLTKQPPTGEFVLLGSDIIPCEAEGNNITYSWKRDGYEFEWTKYRMNAKNGTIITNEYGQYQCFAGNENGTVTSNKVSLLRPFLNSFKNPIEIVKAKEYLPIMLKCEVPNGYPQPEVEWMHVNTFGQQIIDPRMTIGPDANLYISSVVKSDHLTQYICFVSIKSKTVMKTVYLTVDSNFDAPVTTPLVQYAKLNVVAVANEPFEMFCIYTGIPLPTTIWKRNGKRLSNDNYGRIEWGKNSLIIKNVTSYDAGTYTCNVSNDIGTANSTISLTVNAAPQFKVKPKSGIRSIGETFEFRCEVEGKPIPKQQWFFNGNPIKQSNEHTIKGHFLSINNLTLNDKGIYGCLAENSVGYVYHEVGLKVLSHKITRRISEKN